MTVDDTGSDADVLDPISPPDGAENDGELGAPYMWAMIALIGVVMSSVLLFRDPGRTNEAGGQEAVGGRQSDSSVDEPVDGNDQDQAPTTTIAPESLAIVDRLAVDGRFSTLIGLLEDNDLVARLSSPGPFTVFAPTDEAFEATSLSSSERTIRRLLFRHVSPGRSSSRELESRSVIGMLDGSELAVDVADGALRIDGVVVIEADLESANGLIHVIDGVMVVPLPGVADLVAADVSNFNTLRLALEATGLSEGLDGENLVMLAPTDSAFSALPPGVVNELVAEPDRLEELLRHHVIVGPVDGDGTYPTMAGDTITVTGDRFDVARRAGSDRSASRGSVLTPIDTVLVPGGFELADVNDVIGLQPIEFEVASAEITPAGRAELDRAIEYLLSNPVSVEIGGHTDSDASDETNQRLSEQRARAVLDYLVAGGVDEGSLTAVGYGEARPVADNATSEGRAENRRIEFVILG